MKMQYRLLIGLVVGVVMAVSAGRVGLAESEPMQNIPILIMLSEQQSPNSGEYKWWSAYPYGRMWFASQAIANELEEHKFFVFDPDKHKLPDISSFKGIGNPQSLNRNELRKIAEKMDAKLMIVGKAKVALKDFLNNGSAVVVEADVSVKVYSASSNSWIAAAQKKAVATYPLMDYASAFALKNAGEKVGQSLSLALSMHPDVKRLRTQK